jgi:hypothetical protein
MWWRRSQARRENIFTRGREWQSMAGAGALEKDAGDFESLSHERKDQTQV